MLNAGVLRLAMKRNPAPVCRGGFGHPSLLKPAHLSARAGANHLLSNQNQAHTASANLMGRDETTPLHPFS
ncbi:MAG: hypothetical protein CMH69_00040 [Nitratireductor sp.]|nr:hypothetical protein [Nitratireductor sp.]